MICLFYDYLYCRIYSKLIRNPIRKLKQLIWNIKNIIKWIPILWNNFNWDYVFFLKIISFKLLIDSEYYRKDGIAADHKKQAEQIYRTRLAIERIINHKYLDFDQMFPGLHKDILAYEDYLIDQDINYVCKMLTKYMRTWWD